jgi:outer membrane receptor protein involved in Fe transport
MWLLSNPARAAAASTSSGASNEPLTEIVVTAQKREERLQDVPISVTEIPAELLTQQNLVRVQDYVSTIPGVNFSMGQDNTVALYIRGLASGNGLHVVAINVDDAPYGFGTTPSSLVTMPDIDPGDLASIEVLRGPQGTLYGSSSIGGLFKFVTKDPSTKEFTGRVEAGTSTVYNGNELGYSFRASANVPVSDSFAIRASGFTRQDPGYVDNIQVGQEGVNASQSYGGHLSALWRPAEDFSLKGSVIIQNDKGNGVSEVDAGLGDLRQSRLPGTGNYDRKNLASSLVMNAKLSQNLRLVNVLSYDHARADDNPDFTQVYGGYQQVFYPTATGVRIPGYEINDTWTDELRLEGTVSMVDWLFGAFYSHTRDTFYYDYFATDDLARYIGPLGVAVTATGPDSKAPGVNTELAGFFNATIHFTDRFSLQLGARESRNTQSYFEYDYGLTFDPPTVTDDHANTNAFTYLVSPQFKFTDDAMLFFRVGSGYRPGGVTVNCLLLLAPCQYDPDKTTDYELGLKSSWLDQKLILNTSVYYIDWSNLQVQAYGGTEHFMGAYTINAGAAKSEGVEVEAQWRPRQFTNISGWVAFNNAVLTKDFPSNASSYGMSGDRLPYGDRISGNISVDQSFALKANYTGDVGAAFQYVGNRLGPFVATADGRSYFPGYGQLNIHTGITGNGWRANLYCNNVTDVRGPIASTPIIPTARIFITPRTIGVTASHEF